MRALAFLALFAASVAARGELVVNDVVITDLYVGNTRICDVYAGEVLLHSVGNKPTVLSFTASSTDFTRSALPANVTLTWSVSGGVTEVDITRIDRDHVVRQVSASTELTGSVSTQVFASCGSVGCRYVLHAINNRQSGCHRDQQRDLLVRVVTAPTITAFAASRAQGGQLPGTSTVEQCTNLSWTSNGGDPAAVWAITQSGTFTVPNLPSSARSGPGSSPQRVCRLGRTGGRTTFTLRGVNEAGAVSRSASVDWIGGG